MLEDSFEASAMEEAESKKIRAQVSYFFLPEKAVWRFGELLCLFSRLFFFSRLSSIATKAILTRM